MSAADIFLSYSREDRPAARRFAEAFGREGFTVWWDDALHSGETFDEVIEAQLRAANAVVVLWSPRSVASRWVRAEATLADRKNKLAPVVIEPCDRPIIFELTHTVDLSQWEGDSSDATWQGFIRDLRRLVGPAAAAPSSNPAARDSMHLATPAPPSVRRAEYEQTQFYTRSAANPLADQFHCLEVFAAGRVEQRHVVGPVGLKIGRSAPADIIISDARVSRSHCLVELARDHLRVTDLRSSNGTFIDGKRIDGSADFAIGSVLRIGSLSFIHVVRSGAAAGLGEAAAATAVQPS